MRDHHHVGVGAHRGAGPAGPVRAVRGVHASRPGTRVTHGTGLGARGTGVGPHGAARRPGPRTQPGSAATPTTLLCQREPDLFFSDDPTDLRLAKELCGHCPLQAACLAGARERGEPWGVWGGELFLNGEIIAAKRPRGRPRKTDVAA